MYSILNKLSTSDNVDWATLLTPITFTKNYGALSVATNKSYMFGNLAIINLGLQQTTSSAAIAVTNLTPSVDILGTYPITDHDGVLNQPKVGCDCRIGGTSTIVTALGWVNANGINVVVNQAVSPVPSQPLDVNVTGVWPVVYNN